MRMRISEIREALTPSNQREDGLSASGRTGWFQGFLNHIGEDALLAEEVQGFSWDSREVSTGNLYVALIGERVDGHAFIPQVIEKGARAVLMSHPVDEEVITQADAAGCALICVDTVEDAFMRLAAWWRTELSARVFALTGSSGKTTTKTLMAAVLSRAGATVATLANQNNELGVPATILRAERDTQYLVVEIGMRGAHQIEEMVQWVRPDDALVTNVGTSHIELLGSREAIADAKAEIFHGLPANGHAFINCSDDYAARLVSSGDLDSLHDERLIWFSGDERGPLQAIALGVHAHVWVSGVSLDAFAHPHFVLHVGSAQVPVTMQLSGNHAIHNACAAAAVGVSAGLSLEEISSALASVAPLEGRSRITMTPAGIVVIDDAYNANPDSMGASLRSFAAMSVSGRRICVLGDMGELGDFEREGHTLMGTLVAALGFDYLICVGASAEKYLAHAAAQSGMDSGHIVCVSDAERALEVLEGYIRPGDAILVKASHSVGLSVVVKGLVR